MVNYSEGLAQVQPPYDRKIFTDWNLSPSKSVTIIPQKGRVVRAISLGLADRSGGVKVSAPDLPGGDAFPVVVAPNSHFEFPIKTPFTISPFLQVPGLAANDTTTQHTMEILIWYDCVPFEFPVRGPSTDIFSIVHNGGGTASSSLYWVAGRERVTVTAFNTGGGAGSVGIGYVFMTPTFGVTVQNALTAAPASLQGATFEFSPGQGVMANGGAAGPVATSLVPSQILAVKVYNYSTTYDVDVNIEARDY